MVGMQVLLVFEWKINERNKMYITVEPFDAHTKKAIRWVKWLLRKQANKLDGETLTTNYWTSSAKERKPRDTMLSLQVPGSDPLVYVKRSDKMAEFGKDFHENLQIKGLEPPDVQSEAEAKSHVNIKCLDQQSKAKLSQYLTKGDIV
jgi:hypothetical protein